MDTPSQTGFSPSLTARSRALRRGLHPKHPLQITTRTPKGPAFKFELLPLHSPLLRQSRLVSFPPLIDMLKFSGYPHLIRGRQQKVRASSSTRAIGGQTLPPGARSRAGCCAAQETPWEGGVRHSSVRSRRHRAQRAPPAPLPHQARPEGVQRRSDRCAPRSTRERHVRSKIR